MTARRANALLEGAIDLHVHVKPSARNRVGDSRELIEAASEVGMRAVLFKDHDRSTVPDALHANTVGTPVQAFGTVCLNAPVGGLNPAAAEAALLMGARAVFLPTDSAHNDGRFWKKKLGGSAERAAAVGEHEREFVMAIDALDQSGRVLPVIASIIDLCAGVGAIVCTGHLSEAEVTAVVDECAVRGARVVVTHAPMFTEAAPAVLARWAATGAVLELVAVACCGHLPEPVRRTYAMEAALIEEVGASAFALSSDLGQVGNPPPAEGLGMFIEGLLGEGIQEDDIALMTRVNAARALGLEEAS